ncbi:hypothetical protein [Mycobacterium shimoidei]|uniref:DUF4386 domain-containing protein n=1 Tax=Mycobacterium shimoidei TaxID=29313 RepID=A0A1E3THZ8_MYCSH|nr:hypothetical protein [Mycobacterium shimoidei]MCV7261030.1 hypothetical protein [Mycobacterium shimoidei]ODR13617.1 hypothetical protein BHQ16_09780 [Mycobacterium shimoidei]ORW76470.1 hypothetical protein AWC26_20690 [Mycobacterium shimoidei]SRX93628.1 hypothetical protein MSP7336_01871 [Mycobacterium shimoidei]
MTDTAAPQRNTDLWICFWVVPTFYTLFGLIFVPLTRVMPPPRPDVTADQMVNFLHQHALTIQIGFALLMIVIGFAGVANGIVVFEIKRMSVSPAFGYAYMGALAVGALPGCLMAAISFLTAVFRPDRGTEIVALLYELTFLSFVGSLGCFSTAYLVFAIAILLDRNEVFPKWLAYISIWQIVTELLAAPVFIFRSGPLAWNGSISFWMGTAIFAFWQVCLIVLLKKAVERQPVGELVPD